MPIFISYSQKDKDFVDNLAKNLVTAKHHVWMDRWELSLGDSLTQKIQGALSDADAMLVILSKNSVESDWCKRELSAGLIRELEEKQTVVMPCVIDDCQIPLFLRDKLYADFRRNPDEAFDLVDRSLRRISNPLQGRTEQPKFHTDWALDWMKRNDELMLVRCTFVDHGHEWPYVVYSQCNILCNEDASRDLLASQKRDEHPDFLRSVLRSVVAEFESKPLSVRIDDQTEKFVAWKVKGSGNYQYEIAFLYRRMGTDNGMDTIVHLDNNLRMVLQRMDDVLFRPKK